MSVDKDQDLSIVSLDRYDGDAIHVGFSDGSSAIYTVQQLLALTPERMKAESESEEEF